MSATSYPNSESKVDAQHKASREMSAGVRSPIPPVLDDRAYFVRFQEKRAVIGRAYRRFFLSFATPLNGEWTRLGPPRSWRWSMSCSH